jgi:hypothetical protein
MDTSSAMFSKGDKVRFKQNLPRTPPKFKDMDLKVITSSKTGDRVKCHPLRKTVSDWYKFGSHQRTVNYCSLEQNSLLTIQFIFFYIKTVLSKSGRSGALLGLNFQFFTSSWPSEGSMCPNRAAVTPIGQQNPPGPLKLLGLREKINKQNTNF